WLRSDQLWPGVPDVSAREGMNRLRARFERGTEGPGSPPPGPGKDVNLHVGRAIPRGVRQEPSTTQQDVRSRQGLRRAGVRDEALDLQQMEVLLAARTGALIRAARQAQEPLRSRLSDRTTTRTHEPLA